jgi:hypothetical protein
MTEMTIPTSEQVRAALRAGRLARPSMPVDVDHEAERQARVAAGVAVLKAHQAREMAEHERFIQAIVPLYGTVTPAVRLLLRPIVGDLRSLLGAMMPPTTTAAPRRGPGGRFAKR